MLNSNLVNLYEEWLRNLPWYLASLSPDEIEVERVGYLMSEISAYDSMMKTYTRHFSVGRSFDQGLYIPEVIEECVEMDPEDLDNARLLHLSNEMAYLGVFLDRMNAVMGDAPINFLKDAVKRSEDEIESFESEEEQDLSRMPRLFRMDQILGVVDEKDEEESKG